MRWPARSTCCSRSARAGAARPGRRDRAAACRRSSLETDSPSLAGLLPRGGGGLRAGRAGRHRRGSSPGRFTRPLPLDKEFRFFASPCEQAPSTSWATVRPAGPRHALAADARWSHRPARVAEPVTTDRSERRRPGRRQRLDVLRRLAAERAELPLEAVSAEQPPAGRAAPELDHGRPDREPGLAGAGRWPRRWRPRPSRPPRWRSWRRCSTSSARARCPATPASTAAPGVAPWVRPFAVELAPSELAPAPAPARTGGGAGRCSPPSGTRWPTELHAGAAARRARQRRRAAVPAAPTATSSTSALMLQAARAALALPEPVRFVVVGDRRGAAGLAKTLRLEAPRCQHHGGHACRCRWTWRATRWPTRWRTIVADVAATDGLQRGPLRRRRQPPGAGAASRCGWPPAAERRPVLGRGDVLLVTGGGKGITAECALALAIDTGAAIGLLGRSDPRSGRRAAANLDRMAAAGVRYHYVRADVTSAEEVKAAVEEIRERLRRGHRRSCTAPAATSRVRCQPDRVGVRAHPGAQDRRAARRCWRRPIRVRCKLLVTFGSIIGRAGLRGEADYATANDWLTELTYQVAEQTPRTAGAWRWNGRCGPAPGMGERLGVLESLIREGISPIPTEQGIEIAQPVAGRPGRAGRAGGDGTGRGAADDHPGAAGRSAAAVHRPDPGALPRHRAGGGRRAVRGPPTCTWPITCSTATCCSPRCSAWRRWPRPRTALTGRTGSPVLTDMEFLRPIVVPVQGHDHHPDRGAGRPRRRRGGGHPQQRDRLPGRSLPGDAAVLAVAADQRPGRRSAGQLLPLDPAAELYGPVLFQGNRFQRLLGYRRWRRPAAWPRSPTSAGIAWFAGYLPQDLVLGDPGTRDAMMHSDPVLRAGRHPAAGRAWSGCTWPTPAPVRESRPASPCTRRNAAADGDTYIYDLDVRDPARRPGRAVGGAAAAGGAQAGRLRARGWPACSGRTWSGGPSRCWAAAALRGVPGRGRRRPAGMRRPARADRQGGRLRARRAPTR